MSHPSRAAFTVVEVIVALTVVGVVAVMSRGLFDSVLLARATIARESRVHDGRMNAERYLRMLLRRIVTSSDSASRFQGDSRSFTFASRCDVPGGWLEPCAVKVTIVSDSALELGLPDQRPVLLPITQEGSGARLLFLDRGRSEWASEWQGASEPPRAVGVARRLDTTLFRVGGMD